jgi:hypothetical protein
MDPYLESHWRDIHARLVIYAADVLQGVLPRSLRARVEESVLLETPSGIGDHPLYPDVRVVEYQSRRVSESSGGNIALVEPLLIDVMTELPTETHLEITDRESGNRVVTVIEFLSPANKSPGRNREQYLNKQEEICSSDTNLVEIDLNRFGLHTLAFQLTMLPRQHSTPYMVCVRRGVKSYKAEVYPMPLEHRLPCIKIPLRTQDADVLLDLQPLVDQCYRNSGYEGTLNYNVEPDPPLRGVDRDWADKLLREKGLRKGKKPPRRKGKSE